MDIESNTLNSNGIKSIDNRSDTANLTSDFDTFLNLLTVQLTNQDPLNPVDSEDFAVQLATFSSVEQQVQTNEILQRVETNLLSPHYSQLTSWLGKQVGISGPFQFEGSEARVFFDPPADAVRSVLVVRDSSGSVVREIEAEVNQGNVVWDGRDSSGKSAPFGTYEFEVEFHSENKLKKKGTPIHYVRVAEVVLDGQGYLISETGQTINTPMVQFLRDDFSN